MPQEAAPVPLLVPTGGGPRPIEELGPLLLEIVRDIRPVPGAGILGTLALLVALPVMRRRRHATTQRVDNPGALRRSSTPQGEAAATTTSAASRRSTPPPLFAPRDARDEGFAARLQAADGPLEIIDVLRSADAADEPAVPAVADEPAVPAADETAPPPVPPVAQTAAAAPSVAPSVARDVASRAASRAASRRLPSVPGEVAPVGWVLAGAASALVAVRWATRNLRQD
jgi:hypothetical protein